MRELENSLQDYVYGGQSRCFSTAEAEDFARPLRARIAERCLRMGEAQDVSNNILGAEHHWPTSTVVDPGASCTRVDLVLGGSQQIFLYGAA